MRRPLCESTGRGGGLENMTKTAATILLALLALACVDDVEPPALGEFGQRCTEYLSCDDGLVCVTGDSDNSVCAWPADAEPCSSGMADGTAGRVVDGGCVASCRQNTDDCGAEYKCEPVDAFALGFCAPI